MIETIQDLKKELLKLKQEEDENYIKIDTLKEEILQLEKNVQDGDELDFKNVNLEEYDAPEWSIPIHFDIREFNFKALGERCQFDVIVMDPPWQLATHAPTRGVAIGYDQLSDASISSMKIKEVQTNGFLFIWVINNKFTKAFELFDQWGYQYCDEIVWVKRTVNRRIAKGHGFYLQHAKETCLVGKKGKDPPNTQYNVIQDVIFSERRGQSQKPLELYEMIEKLVPDGKYLEIFGRKNNLRDFWVTIGNEL